MAVAAISGVAMFASAPLSFVPVPSSPAAVGWPADSEARPVDARLFARRAARIALGIVLGVGGVALPLNALAGEVVSSFVLLAGTWLAAALVPVLVWGVARASGGLAGRLGDRFLLASLAWPLAGLAIALPLSLHSVFLLTDPNAKLGEWIVMSWAIVGHVHLALAGMAAWRMKRLVAGERGLSAAGIYGITVAIAMVPGAIFLLIPPMLVAVTGLPFLFLLWLPERLIAHERAMLA